MELGQVLTAALWTLPGAALALLLAALFGGRIVPLAAAAGMYLTYGLVRGWPAWPHELWTSPNATEWLLWSVVGAAVLALCETLGLWRARVAVLFALPAAGGAAWLVLQKIVARWTPGERWLSLCGVALAGAVAMIALRKLWTGRASAALPAIVLAMALTFDAMLLGIGHTGLMAQMAGTLSAAICMALVPSLWGRSLVFTPANATWVGLAHVLFLVTGVRIADVQWPAAVLAGVAPVLPLLAMSLATRRPALWVAFAVSIAAVAGIAAVLVQSGY